MFQDWEVAGAAVSAAQRGAEALVSGLESRMAPSADTLDVFAAAMRALRAFAHALGSTSVAECVAHFT